MLASMIFLFLQVLLIIVNLGLKVFNVTGFFIGFLSLGYAQIMLDVVRQNPIHLRKSLFIIKKYNAKAFLMGMLMFMFKFLWSILLVVPGIIKSYEYSMAYFILLDNPKIAPLDAIHESSVLMTKKKWKLFCLDMSFVGWYLLSILTGGVLLCFVIPYHQAARAAFYENIRYKPYIPC